VKQVRSPIEIFHRLLKFSLYRFFIAFHSFLIALCMILSNLFIIGSNNKQASIILKCTQQALTSNEGQSVDLVVIDMNINILHP
jgi:hypothetical protein